MIYISENLKKTNLYRKITQRDNKLSGSRYDKQVVAKAGICNKERPKGNMSFTHRCSLFNWEEHFYDE